MTPYQLYQIERAKSATEIRRADMQLGLMAEAVSRLWHRVTQPIAAMRAWSGTGTPQSGKSAAPPTGRTPLPGRCHRREVVPDLTQAICSSASLDSSRRDDGQRAGN